MSLRMFFHPLGCMALKSKLYFSFALSKSFKINLISSTNSSSLSGQGALSDLHVNFNTFRAILKDWCHPFFIKTLKSLFSKSKYFCPCSGSWQYFNSTSGNKFQIPAKNAFAPALRKNWCLLILPPATMTSISSTSSDTKL